ncbi:MAG: hypothetical protein V1809_01075 [Planctomycetota bacterium]
MRQFQNRSRLTMSEADFAAGRVRRGSASDLKKNSESLPSLLRPLFWDCSRRRLSWAEHAEFITRRILEAGDWTSVKWLLRRMGKARLRAWLLLRGGRGLDVRRMRFWETVLRIPPEAFDACRKAARRNPWGRRTAG